ncbi:hypothetical protein SDC9_191460 [bioreactor metagenome]|uniref:Uncharacterized protein n=1 Tax=bioreactor metagenome TaxID=1076179 RepID=A0A645I0D3_9ZZZZ
MHAFGDYGVLDFGALVYDHSRHQYRIANDRAFRDRHGMGDDGVFDHSLDRAALRHDAVPHVGGLGQIRGRTLRRSGVYRPRRIEHAEAAASRKHIHVRIPKALNRPDVFPVAREPERGKLPAAFEHVRNYVLSKVVL